MAKKKLNVAMIGYDFMGRAHSNAWRQVARFMPDLPYEPVMKVVAGRTEAKVKEAAERLGWEEYATRWEDVIARKDIDIIDICTPGDSHMPIAIAAAEAKSASWWVLMARSSKCRSARPAASPFSMNRHCAWSTASASGGFRNGCVSGK
jgi:Oxidoreductase family, NAD-binding Rossmann fold